MSWGEMFPLGRRAPNLVIMEGNTFGSSRGVPRPMNSVCAFCEGSWQVPVGVLKSSEQKALEDIAADHFKKRVLKAEEISLNDTVSIADDVERCCQLLNAIVLCDGCIAQFCNSEAKILKAQLDYLVKMTGPKEFSDLLADPWLDLKRFAYAKLKTQQESISEKLRLIEEFIPTKNESAPGNSASTSSASTKPTPPITIHNQPITTAEATTTEHARNPASANLPVYSGDSITIDVSSSDQDQIPPACQFAVSSDTSNSSCGASPNNRGSEIPESYTSAQSAQSPGYETADEHESTIVLVPPPSVKNKNIGNLEENRQADSNADSNRKYPDSAEDYDDDMDTDKDESSVKSFPPNTRSRKTPSKPKRAPISTKTEAPNWKRPKLDLDSTNKTNDDEATTRSSTPVVYAKKSAPVVVASPLPKGKPPTAASTPKDNPTNKASRRPGPARASQGGKLGIPEEKNPDQKKLVEKNSDKVAKNDNVETIKTASTTKMKTNSPSSGFSTPLPLSKSPKKVVKVGGRTFTENGESSDEPDSSSDSDSD